MKNRRFVKKSTKSSFYRNREKDFRKFYPVSEDKSLVYCTDLQDLMNDFLFNNHSIIEQFNNFLDDTL